MRAAADPKQVKVVADAHHTAFGSASSLDGEIARADWKSMNEALDRVIASKPESMVMHANAVSNNTDPE
eukprot:11980231-Alexandrium_andersonii.AAC.1